MIAGDEQQSLRNAGGRGAEREVGWGGSIIARAFREALVSFCSGQYQLSLSHRDSFAVDSHTRAHNNKSREAKPTNRTRAGECRVSHGMVNTCGSLIVESGDETATVVTTSGVLAEGVRGRLVFCLGRSKTSNSGALLGSDVS